LNNGAHQDVPELFVGDASKHMVARLPVHGFQHTDFTEELVVLAVTGRPD
jgi:hypothetical protein